MPLSLPELDDRRFQDLVDDAIARIPTLDPNWTDFNPSDPGITLVELLAWLTELVLYRVNQVPEASYYTFLRLLSSQNLPETDLERAIREVISDLRKPYRAVTVEDYQWLALNEWQQEGMPRVARVHCLPQRNLEALRIRDRFDYATGHISVIILPESDDPTPQASAEMLESLYTFFKERRTLTTRHHIVNPDYVPFRLEADVVLYGDARPGIVQERVTEAARQFFHPLSGGTDGSGWEFGRSIYLGEVYQLVDSTMGVNYVSHVRIVPEYNEDHERFIVHPEQQTIIGFELLPHELPSLKAITLYSGV